MLVIVTHPIFHVAAAPSTPPDKTVSRALSPLAMVTASGQDHASSSVGSTASCSTALGASPLAAAVSAPDGPPAKYASLQVRLAIACCEAPLLPSVPGWAASCSLLRGIGVDGLRTSGHADVAACTVGVVMLSPWHLRP